MSDSDRGSFEILLVEDNRADVLLAKMAFENDPSVHRVHVAMDGDEALAFLRRKAKHQQAPIPDLILLDLNLPGTDGREVLAEIKSDPALRRIPVVVLTSSQSEHDLLRCYDLHANAIMSKGGTFEQLQELAKKLSDFWFTAAELPSS